MADVSALKLRVVDGLRLPAEYRTVLMPGGALRDKNGQPRLLPRFFYEVPSWDIAKDTQLTPNFGLWEFIHTDVREAEPQRSFPRYVPCAVTLLALALQRFRDKIGPVFVAANGGYRSPHHGLTIRASVHCWGTAADIYKIGDSNLDSTEKIERCAAVARDVVPGAWTHPVGSGPEHTDDHLHLDIGYVLAVPHEVRVDSGLIAEVTS